jgi:hypothetical protein
MLDTEGIPSYPAPELDCILRLKTLESAATRFLSTLDAASYEDLLYAFRSNDPFFLEKYRSIMNQLSTIHLFISEEYTKRLEFAIEYEEIVVLWKKEVFESTSRDIKSELITGGENEERNRSIVSDLLLQVITR